MWESTCEVLTYNFADFKYVTISIRKINRRGITTNLPNPTVADVVKRDESDDKNQIRANSWEDEQVKK